jgi:hypothetical protein
MRKILFALAALALVSLLATASFAGDATTVNGWISDSKCGANALKGHEGHHVAVTGKVDGDSIQVDSAKML